MRKRERGEEKGEGRGRGVRKRERERGRDRGKGREGEIEEKGERERSYNGGEELPFQKVECRFCLATDLGPFRVCECLTLSLVIQVLGCHHLV